MPMPPMPTKWMGPISVGSFILKYPSRRKSARCRYHIRHAQHQIGEAIGGIEHAGGLGAGRHRGKLVGIGGEAAAISLASRSGVKSSCCEHDRAAGLSPARWRWRADPDRAHAATAPGWTAGRSRRVRRPSRRRSATRSDATPRCAPADRRRTARPRLSRRAAHRHRARASRPLPAPAARWSSRARSSGARALDRAAAPHRPSRARPGCRR